MEIRNSSTLLNSKSNILFISCVNTQNYSVNNACIYFLDNATFKWWIKNGKMTPKSMNFAPGLNEDRSTASLYAIGPSPAKVIQFL